MSREEAIRQSILDYCDTLGITPTELARRGDISKSYINKIVNCQWGKLGISYTYLSKIAKCLNMDIMEYQELLKKYQEEGKADTSLKKDEIIIKSILSQLEKFNANDLEKIYNILLKCDSNRLENIYNLLKSM